MNASDVMSTNVISVHPDASVQEAANILLGNRISGLPVVDEHGRLLGILSEGDLIRRAELGTERHRSWWLELFTGEPAEALATEYVKSHGRRVGDVMTRDVITATPTTPLGEIATMLEKNHIRRVPIVEDGKVVGIVSRANIVQALATLRKKMEPATMTDAAVREKVMAQLASEPWGTQSSLNVTVENGTVELWGVVGSEAEKTAARVAAEGVAGVRAIENHISVRRFVSGF
jgi:CBS domain-containing protein